MVFDTVGLIALARLDLLGAVAELIGTVLVPRAVFDEGVRGDRPGADAIRRALESSAIEVVAPVAEPGEAAAALGPGEMATLELAAARRAMAVLDDRDARRVAARRGISLTGTVALLVRLRKLGALESLSATLDDLESMGFRMTGAVRALALESAGEDETMGTSR